MTLSATDLTHLPRCVAPAREGLEAGDEPFGSLLVDGSGEVRFEDRNRVKDGDRTRHPELEIARWSARHRVRPADPGWRTVPTGPRPGVLARTDNRSVGVRAELLVSRRRPPSRFGP